MQLLAARRPRFIRSVDVDLVYGETALATDEQGRKISVEQTDNAFDAADHTFSQREETRRQPACGSG